MATDKLIRTIWKEQIDAGNTNETFEAFATTYRRWCALVDMDSNSPEERWEIKALEAQLGI